MKLYLLDTNIIIAAMKGHPSVCQYLEHLTATQLRLSSIVLGELVFGAEKSQQVERNLAKLDKITPQFEFVDINVKVIGYYGKIRAHLERKGMPIGANDTWIAAQSLAIDAILVTDNIREFSRVEGLKIANWIR